MVCMGFFYANICTGFLCLSIATKTIRVRVTTAATPTPPTTIAARVWLGISGESASIIIDKIIE